jgi:hypothetical protein
MSRLLLVLLLGFVHDLLWVCDTMLNNYDDGIYEWGDCSFSYIVPPWHWSRLRYCDVLLHSSGSRPVSGGPPQSILAPKSSLSRIRIANPSLSAVPAREGSVALPSLSYRLRGSRRPSRRPREPLCVQYKFHIYTTINTLIGKQRRRLMMNYLNSRTLSLTKPQEACDGYEANFGARTLPLGYLFINHR